MTTGNRPTPRTYRFLEAYRAIVRDRGIWDAGKEDGGKKPSARSSSSGGSASEGRMRGGGSAYLCMCIPICLGPFCGLTM